MPESVEELLANTNCGVSEIDNMLQKADTYPIVIAAFLPSRTAVFEAGM